MFSIEPKDLQRLEPFIRRVLIVDPYTASARMLGDLLKGMGCRQLTIEPEERRALEMARDVEPNIIFVERSGVRLDGESFTRRLRRSSYLCRKAPVIMVTSDATATSIRGARDSGVHEFIRKPFTAGDVLKRVEVVATKPRDWIEGVAYVGPDRRRFNSGEYSGPRKRKGEGSSRELAADLQDRALRILRSAAHQFEADPEQAIRAAREQAMHLRAVAENGGDARMGMALSGLDLVLSAGTVSRALLAAASAEVIQAFGGIKDAA